MGASSLTDPVTYNIPANFAFNGTNILFPSGGPASLRLLEQEQVFAQDFTDDTGFTYNNTLAEFVAGILRTKDQTPTNSVLAVSFPTDANPITTEADLNWRNDGGSLSSIANGSPTIVGGRLVCTGTQGRGYTRTTSAIESWFVDYIPNYTGAPPQNINILTCGGTGNNDRLNFTHSPSGDNLRINLHNSTGTNLISTATIGGSGIGLVAGTVYRFCVVANATAGTVSVYRKSGAAVWVLHGTLTPGPWTRGGVSRDYYIGAAPGSYNVAEASFDNFWVFNDAQDPLSSDITGGLAPSLRKYLESKIDLPNFVFSGVGAIISVVSSMVSETGPVRYIVAGRYWNGSAWAVSDGSYAQASASAATIANLPSFPATGATIVPVSVVFGTSNTLQSIDAFSVTVLGTTQYPTGPHKVVKNSAVQADTFEGIEIPSGGIVTPNDTEVRFTLNVNGQEMFYNTSTEQVENSDGSLAQLNTLEELNENKEAFDWSLGVSAKVTVWLITNDTTVTPSVIQVDFNYNFFNTQAEPPTCTIWGFYRDISGKPVSGATVTFRIQRSEKQYREAGDAIIEKKVSVLTDVNGRFEADLIRSSAFEGGMTYEITVQKTADELDTSYLNENQDPISFEVPDSTDMNVTGLITAVA